MFEKLERLEIYFAYFPNERLMVPHKTNHVVNNNAS